MKCNREFPKHNIQLGFFRFYLRAIKDYDISGLHIPASISGIVAAITAMTASSAAFQYIVWQLCISKIHPCFRQIVPVITAVSIPSTKYYYHIIGEFLVVVKPCIYDTIILRKAQMFACFSVFATSIMPFKYSISGISPQTCHLKYAC